MHPHINGKKLSCSTLGYILSSLFIYMDTIHKYEAKKRRTNVLYFVVKGIDVSCIQAYLGIIINVIFIVTAFGDDCLPCLLLKLAEFFLNIITFTNSKVTIGVR